MNVKEYREVAHKMAARRMKGTPEGDLLKAVMQRICYLPGVDPIRMNTGALMAVGQGGKQRPVKYGYPGMADIYCRVSVGTRCRPRWETLWIELKADSNQSAAQVAFQEKVERWGDHYTLARDVDDCVNAITYVQKKNRGPEGGGA